MSVTVKNQYFYEIHSTAFQHSIYSKSIIFNERYIEIKEHTFINYKSKELDEIFYYFLYDDLGQFKCFNPPINYSYMSDWNKNVLIIPYKHIKKIEKIKELPYSFYNEDDYNIQIQEENQKRYHTNKKNLMNVFSKSIKKEKKSIKPRNVHSLKNLKYIYH